MGQAPCFDWVVKKRDIHSLMCALSGYIKQFYPHKNLRAKLEYQYMTNSIKPQVGDLVCDINYSQWEQDFGLISLIETDKMGTFTLFVGRVVT